MEFMVIMAKRAQKIDELLDLLKEEKVMAAIMARLTVDITPVIKDVFNSFVDEFSTKLEKLVEKSAQDLIDKHCEALNNKVTSLESENDILKSRMNEVENNLRLDNLMIHGLMEVPKVDAEQVMLESKNDESSADSVITPASSADSVITQASSADSVITQAVLNLCNNHLGLKVSGSDVAYAFRIPANAKGGCRPVIVRFVNRKIRNMVYSSRKSLHDSSKKGSKGIYINEHLTKTNAQLYAKARGLVKEKKIASAWTSGGVVFIRQSESLNEKPKKITSQRSLDDF